MALASGVSRSSRHLAPESRRWSARLPWLLTVALLVAALLWAGWLARKQIAGEGSLLDRLEVATLDWRLLAVGPLSAPKTVAVVAIDDAAVTDAGGYPLPRERVAQLVDTIGRSGAKAIAIDILFAGGSEKDAGNAALSRALATLPSVIAAAATFDKTISSAVPIAESVLSPAEVFKKSAKVGLVNVSADAGGTPRLMPMLVVTPEGPMPSILLSAAGLGTGRKAALSGDAVRLGETRRPLDIGWYLPLRFYGPSTTIETISVARLLKGETDARLKGRLVFLGVTATAIGDNFNTPFDPQMPGVEVLATGAANLIEGTALIRDGAVRRIDAAAAVVLAGVAVALIAFVPLPVALSLVGVGLLAWLGVTVFAVSQGFWLASVLPLAAVLPPAGLAASVRLYRDRRLARMVVVAEAALRRFQPRALAVHIAENPDYLMVPEKRDLPVLFVDLAGFTGMSERLGAARTRDVLKEFHTLVVEELVPRGGVVLNFMGDGAMVVFGLPEGGSDDATNAVVASLAVIGTVRRWIAEKGAETKLGGVRLGAHYGPVIMSRLGHDEEQHITATGDSVNVASRLMEVAKSFDASIAISKALWDAADVAGLQEPDVWEVVAIRGREEEMTVGLWR
ncbi:CHASE2 domain-containing protein [Jiella mangrovi]|uniref:Adenylate/guanylate cyclase domain-containing protein n=1 Tax=Jiella mangrovi TaxID=2821407 RepID=A0ABS4BLF2_9HYPH|nr:adenylate/guanylate cyclase domain-containing protein [Jiella mangrovi]MBP0617565.1 adenylate/guanylate cyclase domain-containing protein [Jiella mangrovi]